MTPPRLVPRDQLRKLPYVERFPSDARAIELRSFYDHEHAEWVTFIEVQDGELGRMAGGEVISGSYFSDSPVDPDRDFPFSLSTIVARHLSFPGASTLTSQLESGLHEMGAVFGKYDLITRSVGLADREKAALLEAELEYAIGLSRSFYDILQKLIRRLCKTVHISPEKPKQLFENLPDRFAAVVLERDDLRSAESIAAKWGLFPTLADFYAGQGKWFRLIRRVRNEIYHYGKTAPSVLLLKEGPALSIRESPWRDFPVWHEAPPIRSSLGSLRAFLAYLFSRTISATDEFLSAFLTNVAVPQAIGMRMNVYVRDPFSVHLVRLPGYLEHSWTGDTRSSAVSDRSTHERPIMDAP